MDCIFCRIVRGEAPSHVIWEDEKHMAFLSIFPNTEGVSVVITKEHFPSYVFDLPEGVMVDLIKASKEVAHLLDSKLEDVGRTALLFEGFGVNHIHAKLFPLHGTKGDWQPINSTSDKFFTEYEGYISSHDCNVVSEKELKSTAAKFKD